MVGVARSLCGLIRHPQPPAARSQSNGRACSRSSAKLQERGSPLELRLMAKRAVAAASLPGEGNDDEAPPELQEDARDFRARLIAQQRAAEAAEGGDGLTDGPTSINSGVGWMYETPLIEQGSVLLGGTKQTFGFALRQQYFHKCVLLLLEHSATFTKGIILNRPTALKWEDASGGGGWDVWFGGDVQEGGFFNDRRGRVGTQAPIAGIEMICLHKLENLEARAMSKQVIKSVYSTTFEAAKQLVASGVAQKQDFWLFFGYCGWAPGQLQGELERDSWYMAAADSSVLLDELLTQASDPLALPRLTDDEGLAEGGDGIGTWTRLMHNIGRSEEVREQAESRNWVFDDSMLREWVRQKLTERELQAEGGMRGSDEAEFPSFLDVRLGEGTLLRAGDCPGFILDRQFLYKSLLVVLNVSDKFTLGAVLNRPTATVAQLALEGASETINRRVCFGGDIVIQGQEVYVSLLPSSAASEGCEPLGSSGLSRLAGEVPKSIDGSRLLILRGFMYWDGRDLQREVAQGKYVVVQPEEVAWEELWELSAYAPEDGKLDGGWTSSLLGVNLWQGVVDGSAAGSAARDEVGSLAVSLGDLALLEWAKVFAE